MKTLKSYLAPIGLFLLAIVAILRYFLQPKATTNPFPSSEEKKQVQADIAETKAEISAVEQKQYSDAEIEEKFNK